MSVAGLLHVGLEVVDRGTLAVFALAFGVAVLATALVRLVAPRLGIVAAPRTDRWHDRPVPLLGGLGIFCGLAAGLVLEPVRALSMLPVIVAGGLGFAVGVFDDVLPLKPATKLLAQIGLACLAIVLGGSRAWFGVPALDALVSLAWIVAVANAFNLIDNIDGLCAGIAVIGAAAFAVSIGAEARGPVLVAAAVAGAAGGFLVHNFPRASVFMGDSGSLLLGATLGTLTLYGGHTVGSSVAGVLAVPVLLMAIPLFDVAFVTLTRTLAARSAAVGGRDHTSHRLVMLGMSDRQAVLLLYSVAIAAAASAIAIAHGHPLEGSVLLVPLLLGVTLLGVHLARVPVYENGDFALLRDRRYTPLLVEFTYKRRIFEVLLDFALIVVAYFGAYLIRFDRDFMRNYDLLVASLPIVIACHLVSFFVAGVYRGVWRFVSLTDLVTYVRGVAAGSLTSVLALVFLYRFYGYSRMVFVINGMLLLLMVSASRLSFRLLRDLGNRQRPGAARAIIYGAGEAGMLLLREIRTNASYDWQPLGFIDDDRTKWGRKVGGLPVHGGLEWLDAPAARDSVDVVIVSTASLEPDRLDHLQRTCAERGTHVLRFQFRVDPLEPQPSGS